MSNEADRSDWIELAAHHALIDSVPAYPQYSYENILRYGFKENYLRENWVAQ